MGLARMDQVCLSCGTTRLSSTLAPSTGHLFNGFFAHYLGARLLNPWQDSLLLGILLIPREFGLQKRLAAGERIRCRGQHTQRWKFMESIAMIDLRAEVLGTFWIRKSPGSTDLVSWLRPSGLGV